LRTVPGLSQGRGENPCPRGVHRPLPQGGQGAGDARGTRRLPETSHRRDRTRGVGSGEAGGTRAVRPTLQAEGLKESLLQYLSTTYALSDEGARESLHRFLGDETSGMFRGPFLRVRTPFTTADSSWEQLLDWRPDDGWVPYRHQVAAFERLSSAHGSTPHPTLLTTGTGSGKTEAFLYPVLDHCVRERAAGNSGIKAVLLYPMNALAADQADRINKLLCAHQEQEGVHAGLYVGDKPGTKYEKVYTRRSDMWTSPPDILITNYKMLDLLLQRSSDAPLWEGVDLRYIVVDEFHTYDGA